MPKYRTNRFSSSPGPHCRCLLRQNSPCTTRPHLCAGAHANGRISSHGRGCTVFTHAAQGQTWPHRFQEAQSDSGDEGEGIEASKLGGSAAVTLAVTTFTPQPLTPQLAIPQLSDGVSEGSVPTTHQSALALPLQRSPPAETATAAASTLTTRRLRSAT
jgi:hypothetical protein